MGDRTLARFTIAEGDLPAARRLLGIDGKRLLCEEDVHGDGTATFAEHDANYGGEYAVDSLQREGIPVVVAHDAGGSYGAGEIAFDGKERGCCETAGGDVAIRYREDIDGPDPGDIERAREFVALRKRALEAIHGRGR